MVNSVINQVFFDRCDIVEVTSPPITEMTMASDIDNEYRTGCFGVKPEDSSLVAEEDKLVFASVRKISPIFTIKPQVFDDQEVNFQLPRRDIKSTTDHPKKAKAAMADDSLSLKFEIENFLV